MASPLGQGLWLIMLLLMFGLVSASVLWTAIIGSPVAGQLASDVSRPLIVDTDRDFALQQCTLGATFEMDTFWKNSEIMPDDEDWYDAVCCLLSAVCCLDL